MKNKLLLFVMGSMLTAQALVAQVPSYVPTNGLVGYWPFSGNANDASGNGNNGTVNGATLTTDRNGNANSAYSFDGQSYIRVTHNQNFNFGIGNYTLSVWANKNGNNFLNALLTKASPHPATGWTFGFINNDIRFLAGVQNSNFLSNGSVTYGPINNGEWNNYIAVFNPTLNSIKIYINGQVVVSDVVSTGLINCDNIFDLMFGVGNPNGAPSGPEFFNGFIDDIGIWNRALTQQEITNLYNASLPQTACLPANVPTTGLVGYWPFCGNANDESGNGNNGTVNGATLTTDRFGNSNSAYNFDGVDDHIIAGNIGIPTNTPVSISVWIKPLQNNGIAEFICLGNSASTTWGILAGTNWQDSPYQTMNYGRGCSGTGTSNIAIAPVLNVWQNIVYVSTGVGGTCDVYVNGNFIGQSTNGNIGSCASSNLFFGVDIFGPNFINCQLDDIGIWNRALTPQEITNLYNANQCITNITVTDTLIINVGQLSFTNPVTWANNITIAPNPASTEVNINFNNITNLAGGSINIINALGQSVATTPITASGTNTTLSLATWGGTGMYFVQIINPQGQIVDIKKIILQ